MRSPDDDTRSVDATIDSAAVPDVADLSDVKVGAEIGSYKLIQLLGEGGFGLVYMAEQREPVQRTVALKVIKLGMDTQQVIGRFSAERQALALMEHPNIAHVLDAGATASGRPYFVMELVKGVPIDEYCDTHNLSLRERLDLFILVCHAIQHAHQKGIIHRDIKPSNVMVTFQDEKAVPKVIDFGIAKATNQRLAEQTMYTQVGDFIGTPDFMSPEQAEMTGLDVDTRSDIYSLGAMLYLLVTGTRPFESLTARCKSLSDVQLMIREETPVRPSTRISGLGEEANRVAQARGVTASNLSRQLSGDLDWIIFKAMEKDRTRRYETAIGLADDLGRYLKKEPVLARPPSATYRMGRLVQRNKAAMAFAGVIISLLIAGTVGTTVGLVKARKEAARSARTAEMMTNMLGGAAPSVATGRDATMLMEMLRASEGSWQEELAGMPDVEVDLRLVVANVYYEIGEFEEAKRQLRMALDLLEGMHGPEHQDIVEPLTDMGDCFRKQGELDEADALNRRAVEMGRRVFDGDAEALAVAISNLAMTTGALGNRELSIEMNQEALAMFKRLFGSEHRYVLITSNNIGTAYLTIGRSAEAESMFRELIDLQRKLLGDAHPDLAGTSNNLAFALMMQGRFADAEPHLRESVAISTATNGPDHPLTANTSASLGWSLLEQEKFGEAESILRDNLDVAIAAVGADHYFAGKIGGYLGAVYVRTGRGIEGEKRLLDAYDILVVAVTSDHPISKFVAAELGAYYQASATASGDGEMTTKAEEWRSKSQ